MPDILIYMTNPDYQPEVEKLLPGQQYQVVSVNKAEDVLTHCQQELFDLALVWRVSGEKTARFVSLLVENHYDTIPIAVVESDLQALTEIAELHIVDFLKLPMSPEIFQHSVEQIIRDTGFRTTVLEGVNWQGSLEEYNLIDLIQMLEAAKQDAELKLYFMNKSGTVYFHEGKVINAEFQSLQGMQALLKMAFWQQGRFSTRQSVVHSQKNVIDKSNQELLLLIVEKLHKIETLSKQLPDFSEAIVHNPFSEKVEPSGLSEKILHVCERPIPVIDLLLTLPEDDEQILSELVTMVGKNIVGKSKDIEKIILEKKDKWGIGKLFSSLSSLFRKKEEMADTSPGEPYYYSEEDNQPELTVPSVQWEKEEIDTIRLKLEQRIL